jgi:lipopolysaccharide export system permease protein
MLVRRLDRYVFTEFWKLFLVTTVSFPILLIVSDLTARLQEYLNRRIPVRDLAVSYVYWLPDSMFMVLPAAVLVATVFTIASLTRHSELTTAKASGTSFYRMIAPIFLGALVAVGLDFGLGAAAPRGNQRRAQLIKEDLAQEGASRYEFVFAGDFGRVYKAAELRADSGVIRGLQMERKGVSRAYPTFLLTAERARYDRRQGDWSLAGGELHVVSDTGAGFAVSFARARDRRFTERPIELMAKQRQPHDLGYGELTRIITTTERSGGDANLLRVERALKIAIPATCIIIALFGAPLATSTRRGGSAYGIAISLATTMIFLIMIQLTRAIGAKGVVPPDFAAWIPGILFGIVGLALLARVET